jgi:RHS repeat-associated protein
MHQDGKSGRGDDKGIDRDFAHHQRDPLAWEMAGDREDPLRYGSGDPDLYRYCGNNPTNFIYLWGPAVDQILADEQVATGSPNDVRWPLADWQGTIHDVATYNAATNVTTIANHKVYEAFGKVHSESGPTVDTIFGFTGRYFDDDTGLQWNLNRWYDPGVGRWLSEDPIGFAAGDPNLYRYVGNSPGMFGDPRGLIELFGEEWVMPWNQNASGFWESAKAYGRAGGRAVAGTVTGTGSGAVVGGGTGVAVGAGIGVFAGGVGAGPGAAAGAGVGAVSGAIGGGIGGFFSAMFSDTAEEAAWRGARGGVAAGLTGGIVGPVAGAIVGPAAGAGSGACGTGGIQFTIEGSGLLGLAPAAAPTVAPAFAPGVAAGASCGAGAGMWFSTQPDGGRGESYLDQMHEAKKAFRSNKDFRRWWHRNYKGDQKVPSNEQHNPDLPEGDILEGYLEWLELGQPKG